MKGGNLVEDTDKIINAMKAAMEKERIMQENSKETVDETLNVDQQEEVVEDDVTTDTAEDVDTVEDVEESEDGSTKSGKSKGLFKNKSNKELAAKDQKIEELTDRLMRNMAEFENFRKRTEKEKVAMFDIGAKNVVEKLLPIVDNFERGLGTIPEKEKDGGFVQGVEMIYRQLMTALDEIGVKPIEAVGQEFNPDFHNAVMHGEDENLGEKIITDEFQKGYMYKDTVVRYSMVKVVN